MKRIFSAAKKNDTLELMIYDQIGAGFFSDGVTAKDVKAQLDANQDVSRIVVRINSPGGSVFEGSAIYSLLTQSGKPVDVVIDGLAASAAFTIAMAGTTISISESAMMMLHNAWSVEMGDANALRKMADTLDKVSSTMLGIYSRRSKQSEADVQSMMDAETWLTAEDAVAKGFADEVIQVEKDDAAKATALAASFELNARFQNTPDALKAAAPEASHVDSEPGTGIIPDAEAEAVVAAVAANIERMKKRVRIAELS
jgi:ATP-dependent Clp protease protease subunit